MLVLMNTLGGTIHWLVQISLGSYRRVLDSVVAIMGSTGKLSDIGFSSARDAVEADGLSVYERAGDLLVADHFLKLGSSLVAQQILWSWSYSAHPPFPF